jgi:hypothetical protein
MKTFLSVVVVVVAIWFGWWVFEKGKTSEPLPNTDNGNGGSIQNSLSDGVIKFSYPKDFGLAVTQEQLSGMVKAYIPPCSEGFEYCLYYNGVEFQGTNFESAGIRFNQRADLTTEKFCLNTSPLGYSNIGPSTNSLNPSSEYSASVFSPLGDAGAGHYANGELYRIFVKSPAVCYELETRIGETQFANYPAGTVSQFNESNRNNLYTKFTQVFNSLALEETGTKIQLPDSEN